MSVIRSRNHTIDLFRFLTCPFILLIHCPLSGEIGKLIISFGRFGVPFFLLLSGWFSYTDSVEKMIGYAKRKLYDATKLLGMFFVSYFIMNSIAACLSGRYVFSWVIEYCNIKSIAYFLLFNRALFFGSTGYYPFMLVYVYIIFIILLKCGLLEKFYFAIPCLLIANIFLSKFTEIPWFCYGNFLFTGLPLFLLGHWLHQISEKLPDSVLFWLGIFLLGVVLTFLESMFTKDAYCYIGSILMAVGLLMFAIFCEYEMANQSLLNATKQFSMYIFVIHCGIRDVLRAFLSRYQLELSNNSFVGIIILVTLAVCFAWYYFSFTRIPRKNER